MNFLTEPNIRLIKVLSSLQMTPYRLAKKLNYKSAESVYAIIDNRRKIGKNFYRRIEESDLNINCEYIEKGYGSPLNLKLEERIIVDSKIYPSDLDYYHLTWIAKNIIKKVITGKENIIVLAKKIKFKGVELKFINFGIDENKKSIPWGIRMDIVSISPLWYVDSYYDWWSLEEKGLMSNCQDLLKLYDNFNIKQSFNNALHPIQENLLSFRNSKHELVFENQPLKQTEKYITLLQSNPRISLEDVEKLIVN